MNRLFAGLKRLARHPKIFQVLISLLIREHFQVIGDATPDASKLMKREGVRSVPSFHYFKNGEKIDVVNGANAEAIEAAIKKHQ